MTSSWFLIPQEVGDVSVYYICAVRKEGRKEGKRGFFCNTFPSVPVFPDDDQ